MPKKKTTHTQLEPELKQKKRLSTKTLLSAISDQTLTAAHISRPNVPHQPDRRSLCYWLGQQRKIEDGKKNINESIMRARRLQIQHTHTGTHSLHSFYQNEAFIASWSLSVQIFVTSFSVAFTAALSFYHLIQDVEQDVGLISRQSVFNLNLPVQRNSHAIKDQLRPNGIVSLSPV